MKKHKVKSQELVKKSLTLTDSLSELEAIIGKLYVLSSDVFENYIEKFNLKTERGRLTAELDFDIIKTMVDIMHSYIVKASEISRNLPELSDSILEELREEYKLNY